MKLPQLLSTLFFVTVVFFSATKSQAQELPVFRKNAVYAELGGTALKASISYERLKLLKKGNTLAVSIGVGAPVTIEGTRVYMVPVQFNWLLGKSASRAELGFSINPAYHTYTSFKSTPEETSGQYYTAMPSIRIGYRYTGPKGLVFRAGYTPMLVMFPWAGVSLGYSF